MMPNIVNTNHAIAGTSTGTPGTHSEIKIDAKHTNATMARTALRLTLIAAYLVDG